MTARVPLPEAPLKVLVVEDETKAAAYLRKGLTEHGFTVDVAANGRDGLSLAAAGAYDLIVLDVMLPERDGWSVLAALRAADVPTPVLFLTARDAVEDRVKGLELGADDYLVKPFDLGELLARVRALIRRSAGEAANDIALGDVTLDLGRRAATRAGLDAGLTAFEFNLVEFLALRRGAVVSRTTLYEHLFDEADDSASNLLDVHVSNVRKKLGRDFIQTRRGVGYAIDG